MLLVKKGLSKMFWDFLKANGQSYDFFIDV